MTKTSIVVDKLILQFVRWRGVCAFIQGELDCPYADEEIRDVLDDTEDRDVVLYLEGEFDAAYFGAARLAQELSEDLLGRETSPSQRGMMVHWHRYESLIGVIDDTNGPAQEEIKLACGAGLATVAANTNLMVSLRA